MVCTQGRNFAAGADRHARPCPLRVMIFVDGHRGAIGRLDTLGDRADYGPWKKAPVHGAANTNRQTAEFSVARISAGSIQLLVRRSVWRNRCRAVFHASRVEGSVKGKGQRALGQGAGASIHQRWQHASYSARAVAPVNRASLHSALFQRPGNRQRFAERSQGPMFWALLASVHGEVLQLKTSFQEHPASCVFEKGAEGVSLLSLALDGADPV